MSKRVSASSPFPFQHDDVFQLLQAYYTPAGKGWKSRLERQDMQGSGPRLHSATFDRSRLSGGNALLKELTHPQVDWALEQLRRYVVVRAGRRIEGWLEYCLRVWVGHTPRGQEPEMPGVRPRDLVRALAMLGHLLQQVLGQIDRPGEQRKAASLDALFQQLQELP
ncbi:MAG: hypothetical protein ACO1RX_08440 [Candidatus Sericytochromatia bacterium]